VPEAHQHRPYAAPTASGSWSPRSQPFIRPDALLVVRDGYANEALGIPNVQHCCHPSAACALAPRFNRRLPDQLTKCNIMWPGMWPGRQRGPGRRRKGCGRWHPCSGRAPLRLG
jgi:hypothetical protein